MNQVVARFKDGRVLKGTSLAIDPGKASFPIRSPGERPVDVALADLKALFFVRSLDGDATHAEEQELAPGDSRARGATLVKLEFADGEKLAGLMNAYPPTKAYFYMTPVDPKSNNIRMLVNRAAVTAMEAVQ